MSKVKFHILKKRRIVNFRGLKNNIIYLFWDCLHKIRERFLWVKRVLPLLGARASGQVDAGSLLTPHRTTGQVSSSEKPQDLILGVRKAAVWGRCGPTGVEFWLGHHRCHWLPGNSRFWGLWDASRPGTSGSESPTSQMPLYVIEELITEWKPSGILWPGGWREKASGKELWKITTGTRVLALLGRFAQSATWVRGHGWSTGRSQGGCDFYLKLIR